MKNGCESEWWSVMYMVKKKNYNNKDKTLSTSLFTESRGVGTKFLKLKIWGFGWTKLGFCYLNSVCLCKLIIL